MADEPTIKFPEDFEMKESPEYNDLVPIYDTTTGKSKKTSLEKIMAQTQASIIGSATPSGSPSGSETNGQSYRVSNTTGAEVTYANFLTNVPDGSGGFLPVTQPDKTSGYLVKNSDGWVFSEVPVDVSGLTSKTEFDPIAIKVNSTIQDIESDNLAEDAITGYLSKTDGSVIASDGWLHTDFIDAVKGNVFRYKGIVDGTNAAAFVIYDNSGAWLETLVQAIDSQSDYTDIIIPDTYSVPVRIKAGYKHNTSQVHELIKIETQVKKQNVEGLISLESDVSENASNISIISGDTILSDTNLTTPDNIQIGIIDGSGNLQGPPTYANWRAVYKRPVNPGDTLEYTGIMSGSTGKAVVVYDSAGINAPLILLGINTDGSLQSVTVPDGYNQVSSSARGLVGDQFILTIKANKINTEVVNLKESVSGMQDQINNLDISDLAYYFPKYGYAEIGQPFRMYPFGILGKHPLDRSFDLAWSRPNGNYDFLEIIPAADNESVSLKVRAKDGLSVIGSTIIKAFSAPVSPSDKIYILSMGDSTDYGEVDSGIQGAVINEQMRVLTGVGYELNPGAQSRAPYNLSNIEAIGTRGDKIWRCEGRGGWTIGNYLTLSQKGTAPVITNAFWNPTTSSFDPSYYFSNNGFNDIAADGSNLVIYFQCIWNSFIVDGVSKYKEDLAEFLSIWSSQYPNAEINIVGIWQAPDPLLKDYTGTRDVSAETIMRDAVIAYSNAVDEVIAGNDKYEFIPIAPFFSPNGCFSTVSKLINPVLPDTAKWYIDHVHPTGPGYTQIAHIRANHFLYRHCQ